MIYNFKKDKKIIFNNINFLNYDYIIVGTGPSATVLIDFLVKKRKKILVIEKGNYDFKKYETILSKKLKILKYSRTFAVGGTSLDWSQISSYFENFEMRRTWLKKKISWPLEINELNSYYSKIDEKYNFNFKKIKDVKLNFKIPFTSRFFFSPKIPTNFSKYYRNLDFDIIVNCQIDFINEQKNLVDLYLTGFSKIKVKKLILCNGGIESVSLILRSLRQKFLKNLKNKRYVGKYFMDHPKLNIGTLKHPKKEIIKELELKSKKSGISYFGISLKKSEQIKNNLLNTYVRFEKINRYKKRFINFLMGKLENDIYSIRCFFEMEPNINNKIILDKNLKLKVDFDISNKEIKTLNILMKKIYNYFSTNPELEKKIKFKKKRLKTASHHIGGLIFPKLVNRNLKFNGLKNIYCCSSSVFPTSGSVNPTLTICALALRLGNYLIKKF